MNAGQLRERNERVALRTLINNNEPLALIKPLATERHVGTKDDDGKFPLWLALEHHNDPKVIKLLISLYPQALVAVLGGKRVTQWFHEMRRTPRTTCRCTCSAGARRGTRCSRASSSFLPRLQSLSSSTRTSHQNELGDTTFAVASANKAHVEVLESMLDLGKLGAGKRNILDIASIDLRLPLHFVAQAHPDPAVTKLQVRHHPLPCSPRLTKTPCLWTTPSSSTRAPLSWSSCASSPLPTSTVTSPPSWTSVESDLLLYEEMHPVHHAVMHASDIAIIKPLIHEHAPDLLIKDEDDDTPLDCATKVAGNPNPDVLPFVTEAETAYRKCNYPVLIKLCGSTPDWTIRAKLAKDKKDKEDAAEAVFFNWDENCVRENSVLQPPPPTTTKKKMPKKKKKKKSAAKKAAVIEAVQGIELAEIRAVLAASEPFVPPDERKPAALAHLAEEGSGLGDPCDALAAIYESMYGKEVPKHMPAVSVLRACEKVLGLAGDADWEERVAAVELLNELRK